MSAAATFPADRSPLTMSDLVLEAVLRHDRAIMHRGAQRAHGACVATCLVSRTIWKSAAWI